MENGKNLSISGNNISQETSSVTNDSSVLRENEKEQKRKIEEFRNQIRLQQSAWKDEINHLNILNDLLKIKIMNINLQIEFSEKEKEFNLKCNITNKGADNSGNTDKQQINWGV